MNFTFRRPPPSPPAAHADIGKTCQIGFIEIDLFADSYFLK